MRIVIARETTPNGELQLQRRGDDVYEIIYNGIFLMASYNEPSARALARLALTRLPATRTNLHVLVGGLGMGYTLASALADPRVGRADVVEIEPLIVHWNRHYLGDLAGTPLDDPRIQLFETDLVTFLLETQVIYNALLLDVDNGPGWLAIDSNEELYGLAGLKRLKSRLTAGGVLGIWSADTSREFLKRLATVFGNASTEQVVDCTPEGREISATIYLAQN
ncbi:MAG: spermine/spermidine synthase [Anaerolineae bacterium]